MYLKIDLLIQRIKIHINILAQFAIDTLKVSCKVNVVKIMFVISVLSLFIEGKNLYLF